MSIPGKTDGTPKIQKNRRKWGIPKGGPIRKKAGGACNTPPVEAKVGETMGAKGREGALS